MSNQSQWDPSAALRAGQLASTIASDLRENWVNDVWSSLPDETSVFGLGDEADYYLVEEIRSQVLNSLEVVITCSGLAAVYNGDSGNLTWVVSCQPESYDWFPQPRRGRFGCIATVCGTALKPVRLPIHVLAPVQSWEDATSLELDLPLLSSERESDVAAMLLNSKLNAFEQWATEVPVSLEEDRMWISTVITAKAHVGRSVEVEAEYSGWIWGNDIFHPLKTHSVTVVLPSTT